MRFRYFIIMSTLLALCVSGCTISLPDKESREDGEETKVSYVAEYDESMAILSKQSGFAFGDGGYYYLCNEFLHFYDINAATDTVVCSKPDCFHSNSSCQGYAYDYGKSPVNSSKGKDINCLGNMIWYDKQNLYMIHRGNGIDYLMQYDRNFNNEVKVCALADSGNSVGGISSQNTDAAAVCQGYLYYFTVDALSDSKHLFENGSNMRCNRVKLEPNADVEELGQFNVEFNQYDMMFGGNQYIRVCPTDSGVYFIVGKLKYISDTQPREAQYMIYFYDFEKQKLITIFERKGFQNDLFFEGSGSTYYAEKRTVCADNNGNIYILTGNPKEIGGINKRETNKIIRINPQGETSLFYTNENVSDIAGIVSDGKYLYILESYYGEYIDMSALFKEDEEFFKNKNYANVDIVRLDFDGKATGKVHLELDYKLVMEYRSWSGTIDIDICAITKDSIIFSSPNIEIKNLGVKLGRDLKTALFASFNKSAFDGQNVEFNFLYKGK